MTRGFVELKMKDKVNFVIISESPKIWSNTTRKRLLLNVNTTFLPPSICFVPSPILISHCYDQHTSCVIQIGDSLKSLSLVKDSKIFYFNYFDFSDPNNDQIVCEQICSHLHQFLSKFDQEKQRNFLQKIILSGGNSLKENFDSTFQSCLKKFFSDFSIINLDVSEKRIYDSVIGGCKLSKSSFFMKIVETIATDSKYLLYNSSENFHREAFWEYWI